jgi:hypothetical protein
MAEPPDADAVDEPADEAAGGRPSRKPFLLRIPPELMDELRGWASTELRSLNGHIEYLLREAVKRRKR